MTTTEEKSAAESRKQPPSRRLLLGLIPVALLGALIVFLLLRGAAGIFPGNFPPVEDLSFGRVTIAPNEIKVRVTNGGPVAVTVSQVLVDDAYWAHEIEPSRTISRLHTATVTIPYRIVEGEPVEIKLVTSTGLTFAHEVAVATDTPAVDVRFLLSFALIGLYVGVIPVLMGMTWKPFFETLSVRWLHFFMAFTAGVLLFLGIEALIDASDSSKELPTALGGFGVVAVGAVGAFALIFATSRLLRGRTSSDKRLGVAYAVAVGIGLHNLGEGLAVGAAYRLGEIALGAFFVIGFAIHNTTEGIGIVSILGDRKTAVRRLLALGLIAGGPTIIGAWTGAFLFSPLLATVFLAVAAGAIAQVIYEVMRIVRSEAPGGLASLESLGGVTVGLVVMFVTGLLVTA
jgi:zinc transporter, ZIP family